MRRKLTAVLGLLLCLGALVAVGSVTESASAKKACNAAVWKSAGVDRLFGSGNHANIKTSVRYKVCNGGQYANVLQLNVEINPESDLVCGDVGPLSHIDYWRSNPNVIGSWNPGIRTSNCTKTTVAIVYSAPSGLTVYRGSPSNQRCIGGYVTAVFTGTYDDTENMASVCVI